MAALTHVAMMNFNISHHEKGMLLALITHTFSLAQIDEAYRIFENKVDGVIKVAVENI